MPSVGAISFLTVRHGLLPKGEVVEHYTRPGVAGVGLHKRGSKGTPFYLTASRDVANAAAVKTWIESCLALKGTTVTVVDDLGNSWTNVGILDVQVPETPRVIDAAVGGLHSGAGTHWISIQFTCIDRTT